MIRKSTGQYGESFSLCFVGIACSKVKRYNEYLKIAVMFGPLLG
jgi:hypothetical protein